MDGLQMILSKFSVVENLGVVLLDPGMRRHSWCVAHFAWVEALGVGVSAVPSGIVAVDSGGMILLRSWT